MPHRFLDHREEITLPLSPVQEGEADVEDLYRSAIANLISAAKTLHKAKVQRG